MKELTFEELQDIRGGIGGWVAQVIIGIAAFISFLSGFLSGYTNPKACNE